MSKIKSIKIPLDVWRQIINQAKNENRTTSNLIIYILMQFYKKN
jgi:macrodomain Ter protein organizer (MatP/YcbG family)